VEENNCRLAGRLSPYAMEQWSDLAYLLDLPRGFWLAVGVMGLGVYGTWLFR
jgi:hypothetical protein